MTLLGVHVARSLHGRWRRLSTGEREQLEPLAQDVRERALDLRGERDTEAAQHGLDQANSRLADALVDSADSNPEISDTEVQELRDELARELARLASGEVSNGDGRKSSSAVNRASPPERE